METDQGETHKIGRGQHPNSAAALAENRQATQFGGENGNPTGGEMGINTGSYRANARYLSKQKMAKDKTGKFALPMPDEPTPAQFIMAEVITNAMKGDMRAVECLIEQVDGKVAQTNLNADMSRIASMSDDEVDRELDAIRDAAARIDARNGETAAPEEAENADGEIRRGSPPGDATGA